MFIPVRDSPNPPGTPWVTYGLIGLNVLIYLFLLPLSFEAAPLDDPDLTRYLQSVADEQNLSLGQVRQLAGQISRYDLVVFRHGFRPAEPSVVDVFTSMFLHGGLLHLLGNMLFLYIYGDNVEHRLGRLGYLVAYLGTGVAAVLGDGVLRMGSNLPAVGASGAISGVLGLYFLWFPKNRVQVFVFLFPFFANFIELRARIVLGFYIVVQNILPLVLTAGRGSGVALGAHIGGFVAGLGAAYLVDRFELRRPERDVRHRPASPPGPEGSVGAFRKALESGQWQIAAEWFFGTPHSVTRRDVRQDEKVALGDELGRQGHPRAALSAYQRALSDHPAGSSRVAAHLGAARVLMGPLHNPTAAYQHLYAALEARPSTDEEAQARSLLAELSGMVRSVPRTLPR